METVKERIEKELRAACPTKEMDKLLVYMDQHGYYTCHSHSHNIWDGGTAEHVWACYQIALLKREELLKGREHLLKYATDKKLAIVCLLHDLCDMTEISV